MLSVFGITFPIFAIVALGYVLVSTRVIRPESVQLFSFYVMNLALPALIFNAVTSRPVTEVMDTGFLAAYALGSLATILLAYLWFSLSTGPARRSVAVMGSSYSNLPYVGYPLALIAFPEIAGSVLTMGLMVESVLIAPLTYLLVSSASASVGEGRPRRAHAAALDVLRRPVVIALILGLLVSLAEIAPPAVLVRTTSLLEESAAAIALIIIGGSVASLPIRGNRKLAAQIVAGKLLLHPLMTLFAIGILAAFGLDLSPDMRAAALMISALPMLTVFAVIAQEVDEAALASLAQIGATFGAFFTLSALLAWAQ